MFVPVCVQIVWPRSGQTTRLVQAEAPPVETRSVKRARCKVNLQENAAANNDATKQSRLVPLYVAYGANTQAPVSNGKRGREEDVDDQQESKPKITERLSTYITFQFQL